MEKLGFCEKWVSLVLDCISTVSYSILVNSEPKGDIRPSRGLRQGDPLSPYLFLLCSEGLNRMLQKAATDDDIRGFSLCKRGPKISHLLFADDSLLFCRVSLSDLQVIQNILSLYEKASGQKLNREKTTIFFSKAVKEDTKTQISNYLEVPEVKEYEKYLGLPAVIGRKKKESLNYLKERVWSKLQGWKEKLLSQASREILLKAVVQAIPTFAMSCFKLPGGLCDEIEALIWKFFWGQKGEQRKIHWKKWEVLCKPKSERGMGFKDLGKFNDAMLAKQVWRLLKDQNPLFFRVFKAKYFPRGSIFEAQVAGGSYAWQSILKVRRVISKGMRWRIGDGKSTSIYNDNWLPGRGSAKVVSPHAPTLEGAQVAAFINPDSMTWNQNMLQQHFLSFEADRIKSIPLCWTIQEDCLIWPAGGSGEYSVKSGYKILCKNEDSGATSSSDRSEQDLFWKRFGDYVSQIK